MASEKIIILKMLEDGKITADEAARLLDAAGDSPSASSSGPSPYKGPSRQTTGYQPPPPTSSTPPPSGSGYSHYASNDSRGRSSSSSSSTGFDDFTSELGRKFEAFARDIEPKLHKFSEAVVEKTSDFAERITKSLEEPRRAPSHSTSYAHSSSTSSSSASHGGLSEKRFEIAVSSGYNEVNMAGLNGDVLVRGYNGDKITASIFVKPKRANASIELMKLGNKYFLNYDDDEFDKVMVDAYIPEKLFAVANISTSNGTLDISSMDADSISVGNLNGPTKIKGVSAGFLKTECNNGKLTLTSIAAKNAQIENFNGIIDALDLDCANLKLVSVNGGITVNISSFTHFSSYIWDAETSNGKMTLNLPTMPDLGYYLKAHASLGQVKIALSNLSYIYNTASLVEAKSHNYESCRKTAKFALATSNGPLQIS
jgi:DUF4097 and DUF4098 domain-containing protein YvlB